MKRLLLALLVALLAGCATGPRIDTSFSAVGQDSRVRFLVLHYTAADSPVSLKILTQQAVSSHYLVDDKDGKIYGLVDENRRAYHAGISYWRGYTQLNYNSIGIEIVNLGFKETPAGRLWFPYTPEQVDNIVHLVRQIVKRHQILPENVIGHSDIAPQRKTDPGPLFPWKRLADEGLILWPDAGRVAVRQAEFTMALPDARWFQQKLALHGFQVPQTGLFDKETMNVISVLQMKYRPARFDGMADAETAAILDVLTTPPAQAIPMPPPVPSPAPVAAPPAVASAK
jgi:N-acetylmuramoyl-L-alanine amidase